jgi:hypothetical protein
VPFNFYFGLRLLAFLSFSRLVLLDALLRHVALPALGDWCPEFFLKRIPPDFFCQGKKREGRARLNYGQEFWWKPGEPTPERGPDLGWSSTD